LGAAWSQQFHRHAAGDASGQRRVLPSAAAAIVQLEARVSLKRFDSIAAIGSRASRACRRANAGPWFTVADEIRGEGELAPVG
jgi:hypothetical protein